MQQRVESFTLQGLTLRYTAAGKGSQLVLAFHGFGRSPEEFLSLISEQEMLLLSFYLPGHPGADEIPVETIELDLWCQLLEKIVERHNPHSVTVIGYSLGGRIALNTCMNWRIKNFRLLLLAPDGIKMNVLQRLIMKQNWGMNLFRWMMRFPRGLILLTMVSMKLGMLSKPLGHFFIRQLRDDSKRRVILKVYPLFRKFLSSESMTIQFLESISHRLLIVLGKQDPVIPVTLIRKLPALMQTQSVLIMDEASHDVLSDRYIQRWIFFLME